MWKNTKGMTLLEIMIVLAILGGLITILATGVTSRLKTARIKEAKIQIAEISKALDMFYTDCSFYPTTEEGLDALVDRTDECESWGPEPYLKRVPLDPWKNEFIYELHGIQYVLISLGADKQEGGEGESADISSEEL